MVLLMIGCSGAGGYDTRATVTTAGGYDDDAAYVDNDDDADDTGDAVGYYDNYGDANTADVTDVAVNEDADGYADNSNGDHAGDVDDAGYDDVHVHCDADGYGGCTDYAV